MPFYNRGILEFTNSKIENTNGSGIQIYSQGKDVTIRNNEISNTKRAGLSVSNINGGALVFNNNTLINNGGESISLNLTGFNPSNKLNIFQNNTYDGRIGISGTVQQNLTLDKNVYNLSSKLIIPKGISLTIEPGATINQTSSKNTAIIVEGNLEALGTADNHIVFTNYKDPIFGGTTPTTPVYWDGFNVESTGQLKLDHTEIRFTDYNAIYNKGILDFKNSKIENTKGYGVQIYTQDKDVTIENNEILQTGRVGIYIYKLNGGNFNFRNNTISNSIKESITISFTNYNPNAETGGIASNTLDGSISISGTLQKDIVLTKNIYNITGDLTIPAGKNMLIEAGTVLNEKYASSSLILVEGTLQGIGTSENPIIFTDNSDPLVGQSNQFYWEGITVEKNGQFILEYGEIRYAGTNAIYNKGNLDISNSKIIDSKLDSIKLYCSQKNIRIENNEIIKSDRSGVNFGGITGGSLIFRNNKIQDCKEQSILVCISNFKPDSITGGFEFNTTDGIRIYGSLPHDFRLYKNTYVLSGGLTVPKDIKLTIDAGSTVICSSSPITVEGKLSAEGTAKDPVVFTSKGDPQLGGDGKKYWKGFDVSTKGSLKLNYTDIRYPGWELSKNVGTAISCQGTLEMNNSSIKNSKGDGIRFSTYLQPILKNNSFIDIANYSVKNNRSSSFIIDATNNYWGSASGPALYDKTSKTWSADNGKITDGIEFLPFHRAPIFEEDTTSLNIDYADYITTPLESSKEATLKVSISNNTLKAKNCNIEVLCSWDNETWYSKGTKNITITAKQKNYAVNFQYSLFLSGDLHTKVVLYDNSDNSQTSEYIKSGTDHLNIGVVEKYDWYKFSESDLSNITIEGYISEIGGYAGESTETVYAITKRSDEQIWRQYELNNGTWLQTGVTYKTNPIEDTNASSSLKTSLLKSNEQYKSLEVSLPSLKDINESINKKKNDLANKFYNKIGINPSELSNEEKSMVIAGLASSVDDNMYFGVIKSTFGYKDYEDNYYYMKAKSYLDTVYTAAYYTMSVGSAAEAARALNTAGVSGAMAFATSETGAGAVVFGTASVAELAEAAAMSGVSFVSYKMAERSKNIMTESVSKLKKTKGCKIRTVADDILDQMEAAGGHTLEKHVSKTNNDLVNIAITKGHDATSFTNKSTAIKSVKQNLRQNADVIEKWLANSSNQNPLVIDCKHVFETGYGAGAGMKNITYGLTKSEIYMVKDSSMTLGFKIITSYQIF